MKIFNERLLLLYFFELLVEAVGDLQLIFDLRSVDLVHLFDHLVISDLLLLYHIWSGHIEEAHVAGSAAWPLCDVDRAIQLNFEGCLAADDAANSRYLEGTGVSRILCNIR